MERALRNHCWLGLFFFILASCTNQKEEKEFSSNSEKSDYPIATSEPKIDHKQLIIDSLTTLYDISYKLDTLRNYQFTIDYESVIASNCQLIERWSVHDIFRKDSIPYMKIHTYRNGYLTFPLSEKQLLEIKSLALNDPHTLRRVPRNLLLVVKLSEVRKIDYSIITSIEGEGEDAYADLDLDFGPFSFKGKIIDIVSAKLSNE